MSKMHCDINNLSINLKKEANYIWLLHHTKKISINSTAYNIQQKSAIIIIITIICISQIPCDVQMRFTIKLHSPKLRYNN